MEVSFKDIYFNHKGKLLFSSVVKLIHGPKFVVQVKCTIFCINRGLRVYLDLYVPDSPQNVPLNTCFVLTKLESMGLGASQQCVLFGSNVFF